MKPTKHLNDEHMRLYEWSGLCAEAAAAVPDRSKRTHAWHASYGVLAVLTSLLILSGCDQQTAAEQASDQVGQAAQEPPAEPLYDRLTAPADAAAPAAAGTEEPAAARADEPVAEGGGQGGAAPPQP